MFQPLVTLMAVVRERRLTFYNFIILPMCSKSIFKKIKALIKRHACQVMVVICYQYFSQISFVVAMLDNIPSLQSPSVPEYLCTFCTQLFFHLNETF